MKRTKYFDIFVALSAAVLLMSNLAATKLVSFGSIITDGGAILFPIVYILGDILTEVYGYKYARRAIWVSFAIMMFGVAVFTAVRLLPAAPDYVDQAAFESVFGFFPRIVVASLLAFLVGSFVNAYILARLKVRSRGKHLWARLIGSTFLGELLDTVIFALVAFGGILSTGDMVVFVLVGWLFKTGVEIVVLPITYRVINLIKQAEKLDTYDKKTDFSPFQVRL